MDEQWIVDRCQLREAWLEHPDWSKRELAQAVGRSKSWVTKWLKRIRSSTLEDREILQGHSCARKHPPANSIIPRPIGVTSMFVFPSFRFETCNSDSINQSLSKNR